MDGALDLDGSRVLISGAGGGIGSALAQILGACGAHLILSDASDCSALAATICARGGSAQTQLCDVTDRSQVAALAATLGRLDAAVLAAGVTSFLSWDDQYFEDDLDRIVSVNLKGTMRMARAVLPALYGAGGRMVVVGSVAGWTGGTLKGVGPHYAAAKGAVHTLVRWLAREGASRGVLVNGVAPGPTDTGMIVGQDLGNIAATPLGRLARPEEIAWPIAFLCSKRASFMTGSIVDVNGGIYMR